jgi:hypothetical protein
MAKRPPSIAIDWDGTLCEHRWPDWGDWNPGAVDAVKELLAAGCKVFVFSVRVCTHDPITGTYLGAEHYNAMLEMRRRLDEAGLQAVDIYVGNKPLFDLLIDDRAIRFPPRRNAWRVMPRKVLARMGVKP